MTYLICENGHVMRVKPFIYNSGRILACVQCNSLNVGKTNRKTYIEKLYKV